MEGSRGSGVATVLVTCLQLHDWALHCRLWIDKSKNYITCLPGPTRLSPDMPEVYSMTAIMIGRDFLLRVLAACILWCPIERKVEIYGRVAACKDMWQFSFPGGCHLPYNSEHAIPAIALYSLDKTYYNHYEDNKKRLALLKRDLSKLSSSRSEL